MSGKCELTDIEQLIAEFDASDLRELQVRHGEFEIFLSKDANAPGLDGVVHSRIGAAQPTPTATSSATDKSDAVSAAAPAEIGDLPEGATIVRAPYLGSFYRSPKPGAPAYVEIGSEVSEDTELCLVEVMKLFTSVRAGMKGKIHSVLADDGTTVQADQPLFVVIPV